MDTGNFSQDEFLDAGVMNAAMGATSVSLAISLESTIYPGVVRGDLMSPSFGGLVVTLTLPAPFGVIFGSGVLSQAHGTATGIDTQVYPVDLTSFVPGSGTNIVYIVATYAQVQQTPKLIVGPPVGHPDYNPDFVPYVAYSDLVDSFSITGTLTPANNSTTIELARLAIPAGTTTITAISADSQMPVQSLWRFNHVGSAINKTLTAADSDIVQFSTASSGTVIYTLPVANITNALPYPFVALGCNIQVQCQGSDMISGAGPSPVAFVTVSKGNTLILFSVGTGFQVMTATETTASISVGLTMPGIFAVADSPVVGVGTINVTLETQAALSVFSGPTSGSPAIPTFKDLPTLLGLIGFTGGLVGQFAGLKGASTGNYTCSFTMDQVVAGTALNGAAFEGVSLTLGFNGTTTGINAMDIGNLPSPGSLYIYAIYDPGSTTWSTLGTVAGSGQIVYPGAHMPAGYTASCLICSLMVTNAGTLTPFTQRGRKINIIPILMISYGGDSGTRTWDISTFIPADANSITGYMTVVDNADSESSTLTLMSTNTGIGEQIFGAVGVTGTNFYYDYESFPISVAQTVYTNSPVAADGVNIYLSGFTF